jgi:hypothetical protein
MLDVTFLRLQGRDCHTIPVVHQGSLVGLLTMDNVGEFLGVQTAIGTGASSGLTGRRRV